MRLWQSAMPIQVARENLAPADLVQIFRETSKNSELEEILKASSENQNMKQSGISALVELLPAYAASASSA